ncbi:MAG: ROK family transcriptional regulator [Firmicutes bacterium]|nr:ROK family transcriptional regulator [Bacillota bacterium]
MPGTIRTGNYQLIKTINRWAVMNLLTKRSPISRADMARHTGLSSTTISATIDELLREGLIGETGIGDSSGGRKPVLFEINPHGRYVIVADLGGTKLLTAVVGLDGRPIRRFYSLVDAATQDSVLGSLMQGLQTAWDSVGEPRKVLGIGIATPGLVDHERGVVAFASNLHWHNIRLKDLVADRFDVPVYVDNDTNVAAIGEKMRGVDIPCKNLVYVSIGTGIGAGIIIDGKVYRGVSGAAGEIGHITVDPEGPECSCGNRGCLEAVASGPAIAQMARATYNARGGHGGPAGAGGGGEWTAERVAELATQGDEIAVEAFRKAGTTLGIALSGIVNLLNPELMIIGGGVSQVGDLLLEPLRQEISRRALSMSLRAVPIIQSRLGADSGLMGAWAMVFEETFTGGL